LLQYPALVGICCCSSIILAFSSLICIHLGIQSKYWK
jgi:hypothetical protein